MKRNLKWKNNDDDDNDGDPNWKTSNKNIFGQFCLVLNANVIYNVRN